MFDVGQQKDMLRATGNSPTEPLNCRELPGSLGKAGGSGVVGQERSKERGHPVRGSGNSRENSVFSYQDLLIAAAYPRVTCGLPSLSRYTH